MTEADKSKKAKNKMLLKLVRRMLNSGDVKVEISRPKLKPVHDGHTGRCVGVQGGNFVVVKIEALLNE